MPTFTFGQTIPQTEQTVPTAVKAEPSAGQMQGTFTRQPESSSHFVTPNSLLGNSPSSQQSGFGSDFTFPHAPFQQTRDNNPNIPPLHFPPPVGAAVHQLPHKVFSRPLPGSQKILLVSMIRVQRMRMHGWPWCVITLFL